MIAPITLRRIQGRGRPKKADKVTTPSKMENAGASVKIAVEPMVLPTAFISILICFARFNERIKKKMDWANTKTITMAATM